MNELLPLTIPFLVGILLAVAFFAVLWWTTQQLPKAKHPFLLLIASALFRFGLFLIVFYWVTDRSWQRMLAYLAGFVIVRTSIKLGGYLSIARTKEMKHAS